MPRKNRGPAVVLVLSLLIGLVGQAALAMPLGARPAIAESNAGSFLTAVWGWLTERWSNLSQGLATPAQQPNRAWGKSAAGTDPNNGSKPLAPTVPLGN